MAPAIPQQKCILLVSVADDEGGLSAGGNVQLSVAAERCVVSIEPSELVPGKVAEVTLIPEEAAVGTAISATVRAERQGLVRTESVSFEVWEGEDSLASDAEVLRDRFVPWLAANHPELGITNDTPWEGVVVRPIWLVVSHYLFFSEEWEMGVSWHIMIPPYDWARIYLRHRWDEMSPSHAFEISSRSDATAVPVAIEPPEELAR